MSVRLCAYCPNPANKKERDHVVPDNLYPAVGSDCRVQRLTVPVCRECNGGWSDDEAHFRNVITVAGAPSLVRDELWKKVKSSLRQVDGEKRRLDVVRQLKEVATAKATAYAIYPGEDIRVLRVVRKVVRGLAYHHKLMPFVSDQRVGTYIVKHAMPQDFLDEMELHHRDPNICEYRFAVINDSERDIHSGWLITFLQRVQFIGIVSNSASADFIESEAQLSEAAG